MSKYVDMIGWDDVPHLQPPHVSKEELDEFERNLLPHQREARRTGRPALGSGAIYPVDLDELLVDGFRIPPEWPRAYALDVGWRKTACLWGAHDRDADTYYLVHEYYVGEKEPVTHAAAIKRVAPWMKGCIDPAAAGSNQKDGSKLLNEYKAEGLKLTKANNAIEAGLLHVLILMQTGRLRIFRSLPNLVRELRLYRRDEKGKIVKEMDHLMDCMRYLLNTPGIWSTKPIERGRGGATGEFGTHRR